MVAAERHDSGATFSFSRRRFYRARRRQDAREGIQPQSDRAKNYSSRRGNPGARLAISSAGIPARHTLGALDGLAARGHSKHDRHFDHADGSSWAPDSKPRSERNGCALGYSWNRVCHTVSLHHLAPALAALVPRVLHKRRTYIRFASTV